MFRLRSPFTMIGTLERCLLFTFRDDLENCRRLLPPVLEPVSLGGFGFWNLVVSRVGNMRPKLSPLLFGVSYWHVAYRIYAKARVGEREIEGLYFLRSDCDNHLMTVGGNLMTDFKFHTASINVDSRENDGLCIGIRSSGGDADVIVKSHVCPELPAGSPFATLAEAKEFLKYKPNGLSPLASGRQAISVIHIERDEQAWVSDLVNVASSEWEYLRKIAPNAVPEICYDVRPISYQWNHAVTYEVLSSRTDERRTDEKTTFGVGGK